jgi:hypothetical protein
LEKEIFRYGEPGSSPVKGIGRGDRRLRHMYVELALDNKILKDVLSKKF